MILEGCRQGVLRQGIYSMVEIQWYIATRISPLSQWGFGKEEASLASCGRESQTLGAATQKALSHVLTKCTCEGGGTESRTSLS